MKHTPFVTLALLWVGGAGACLHAGGGSIKTPVTQGGQQAIILHDGKTQDLILRIEYGAESAERLGWVIPLPAANML